jgi:hypothetical protein
MYEDLDKPPARLSTALFIDGELKSWPLWDGEEHCVKIIIINNKTAQGLISQSTEHVPGRRSESGPSNPIGMGRPFAETLGQKHHQLA